MKDTRTFVDVYFFRLALFVYIEVDKTAGFANVESFGRLWKSRFYFAFGLNITPVYCGKACAPKLTPQNSADLSSNNTSCNASDTRSESSCGNKCLSEVRPLSYQANFIQGPSRVECGAHGK